LEVVNGVKQVSPLSTNFQKLAYDNKVPIV